MRVSNTQLFEQAFPVRLMWEISRQAVTDEKHIIDMFRDEYRAIMTQAYNKTQKYEVEEDICRVSNGVFDLLADKQTGQLLTTKTAMVTFGLCIMAAHQGMTFSDRFEDALNKFNDGLRAEAEDEMADVEKSAQKALTRVVKYLHSRFKFEWIEA